MTELLQEGLAELARSAKYRDLAPALCRRVLAAELARQPRLKEAVKAAKGKLHQVAGAYFDTRPDYPRWLAGLAAATPAERPAACAELLRRHASTRERQAFLPEFYAPLFATLPPAASVLDLACGLHPLGLPWMPLPPLCRYLAIDVYGDLAGFLGAALTLLGAQGEGRCADLLDPAALPAERFTVAFLLKTLPCLEQLQPGSGADLLERLPADWVFVSYPTRSLGGHRKGMPAHYRQEFARLLAGRPWPVASFTFPAETVYRIDKRE